jgi:hypothetical protein
MKLHPALTTVTPISKFLAMLLFILLPFVGFYLGMQYGKISTTQTIYLTNNNQGLSFSTPTPSITDDEQIKIACMGTEATNPDLVFSVQERQNTFVKASVNYAHGGGGGYAFAVKQNNTWVCPIQGNGIPDCAMVKKYHFPSSLIKSCTQGDQVINLQ